MIESEKAAEIERRLAEIVGVEARELRDYLRGNIRAGDGLTTGYRFVRGEFGGRYVKDPEGRDIVPAWHEAFQD